MMKKFLFCATTLALASSAFASQGKVYTVPLHHLTPSHTMSKVFQWVNYEDHVNESTLVKANLKDSKTPIHICQARYQDLGVHPGQIKRQSCVITYGGKAYSMKHYNALAGRQSVQWRPSASLYESRYRPVPLGGYIGLSPANTMTPLHTHQLINGGFENGHVLFICRGIYNNEMHVGKVVSTNCNIAANGKEVIIHDFEVMVS